MSKWNIHVIILIGEGWWYAGGFKLYPEALINFTWEVLLSFSTIRLKLAEVLILCTGFTGDKIH